ncbi:MAG: type III polyketide synthase [Pleurocapsa sp.]
MYTVLEAIATANPPFKIRQQDIANFMSQIEVLPKSLRRRIPQIYSLSGIDYRYLCIKDYGEKPENFDFYPQNWSLSPFPSTQQRNQKYRDSVVNIAVNAAQQALWQADVTPQEITHLIVVSCTGFFAPGLDIHLVRHLNLNPTTDRTIIGFMGCYAALNGLKLAHTICQTYSNAKVLVVSAELCSLHFQFGTTLENIATNSLFADGVATAILTSQTEAQAKGKLTYVDGGCLLDDSDSMDHLTWDIGDTGFLVGLSRKVPETIADCLPNYLHNFLQRHSLSASELDFWAIHPGGKRIVEQAQAVLGLSDEQARDSYEVLRLYGNMSSATILFILKRILDRHHHNLRNNQPGDRTGIAMAFGPGLSIEGCLFKSQC